jgi:hypothetical protein
MNKHPAIAARPLLESFWVLLPEAVVDPETRAGVARCVRWERFLLALIEESPGAAWSYLRASPRVGATRPVVGRHAAPASSIFGDERPSEVPLTARRAGKETAA